MQYQLIANSDYIKRIEDDGNIWFVPNEPSNSMWQAYQAWLAEDPNNQPLPADGE